MKNNYEGRYCLYKLKKIFVTASLGVLVGFVANQYNKKLLDIIIILLLILKFLLLVFYFECLFLSIYF